MHFLEFDFRLAFHEVWETSARFALTPFITFSNKYEVRQGVDCELDTLQCDN